MDGSIDTPAPAPDAKPAEPGHRKQQWFELADKRPLALSPPPNKAFADQYTQPVATAVSTLQEFVQGAIVDADAKLTHRAD